MTNKLGSRTFLAADQDMFAAMSGDRNPMHVDPVAARRTQAGAPVVHGVHAMLWALDHFVRAQPGRRPTEVAVRFERFLYVGERVEAIVVDDQINKVVIELRTDGSRATVITLGLAGAARPVAQRSFDPTATVRSVDQPVVRSVESLVGLSCAFRIEGTDQVFATVFPALATLYGPIRLRSLAALSTLVGMECPGLFSIFSKLVVVLEQDNRAKGDVFRYAVRRVQPLLRSVTIDIEAPGIAGHVEAFIRQPPIVQPETSSLRSVIAPDLAQGSRVLVIGGSRGLGELTAKLAALAGADVTITYAQGAQEAGLIANDIIASGGKCKIQQLDILGLIEEQIQSSGDPFTHLYYFATPPIFRKRAKLYDRSVLDNFMKFYVDAFSIIAYSIITAYPKASLFFPSTSAIDERPKGSLEYVISKLAGEELCIELSRQYPNSRILCKRLPRILTDQTATVLPVRSTQPLDLLLPIMREMHRSVTEPDHL